MATREEMEAEVRRRRLVAQVNAKRAQESEGFQDITPEQFEAQGPENWYDRPRALVQGATLGASDELGALAGAAAAKVGQAVGAIPGDKSYWDIYDEMQQQFQDEREQYETANPGEALALNLAGGFGTGGLTLLKLAGKSLLKRGAALATEGGVAGALASKPGERLEGAATGAPLALATAGALKIPGGLLNTFAKRRVQTPLRGRPIHMATHPDDPGTEGAIGNFYRRGVGAAFLGRNVLQGQERPILDAAEEGVRRADVVDDVRRNVRREFEDRRFSQGEQYQEAVGDINVNQLNQVEAVTDAAARQSEQTRMLPQTVKQQEDFKIRQLAADAALPERVPVADREALIGASPDEVMTYLRKWWQSNGFDSVKRNRFVWDSGLRKSLKDMVKADPALKLQLGSVDKRVDALMNKLGKKGTEDLDGQTLMAVRNFFAMAANDTSKIVPQRALREVANRFDDMIVKQLEGDDLAAFQDDMIRWGPTRTYRDAVGRAANKRQGDFGADDYLAATKDRRKLEGTAVLQPEARFAQKKIAAAEKEGKNALRDIGESKRKATGSVRRKNERLRKALASNKRKQTLETKRAEQDDPRITAAQERLDAANRIQTEVKKQAVPENTTWPSQLVSTIAMGTPATAIGGAIGGPAGAIGGAIPGMFTAKALAQMPVQKAVAGQLRKQRQANIALRQYEGSLTEERMQALRRAIERYTAMQGN
jgi:hypothetical protein